MTSLAWFAGSVVFLYGLVLGSFLNVVIYRVPREMSLARPRSHCPSCGAMVRWYDNVPLFSYLVLWGRCRSCQAPISIRYPLVELSTGVLLVLVHARFGVTLVGTQAAILVLLLLPLALIDLEHHLLPDVLTKPGIALGLVGSLAGGIVPLLHGFYEHGGLAGLRALPGLVLEVSGGLVPFWEALLGVALGAAIPYLVIVAYRAVRGVEGMGLGDVKLLAMVGAFLGWRGVALTLGLGSLLGALVGLALIASGKSKMSSELPFGTFLAVAAVVTLFFGTPLYLLLGWVRE